MLSSVSTDISPLQLITLNVSLVCLAINGDMNRLGGTNFGLR